MRRSGKDFIRGLIPISGNGRNTRARGKHLKLAPQDYLKAVAYAMGGSSRRTDGIRSGAASLSKP